MTVSDIYSKLYSRTYYDKIKNSKFRFFNHALFIDRCANNPIVIHMLDGIFYMQTSRQVANESLLRLQFNEDDITLYSATSEQPLWILE